MSFFASSFLKLVLIRGIADDFVCINVSCACVEFFALCCVRSKTLFTVAAQLKQPALQRCTHMRTSSMEADDRLVSSLDNAGILREKRVSFVFLWNDDKNFNSGQCGSIHWFLFRDQRGLVTPIYEIWFSCQ